LLRDLYGAQHFCCIGWTTIDNHELIFRSVMTPLKLVMAFKRPRIHRLMCIIIHRVIEKDGRDLKPL